MPAAISRRASAAPSSCRTTTASARGKPRPAREGRYLGIGIGNYVEGTGLGPFEGVTIRVLPNGKVAVATGATTQGQGTRTTLSQIVADHLGCRIEDIVMTRGRHRHDLAGHRRLRQPPGDQRRLVGDDRRRRRAKAGDRGGLTRARHPRERHRRRGRPRLRHERQQAEPDVRRAGAHGAGHARLLVRAGPNAGARAHRLFHAAAGVLLQRHPCGRGRGRPDDRRRHDPELHGGARQRQRHQSDDRRRPGAGRASPTASATPCSNG